MWHVTGVEIELVTVVTALGWVRETLYWAQLVAGTVVVELLVMAVLSTLLSAVVMGGCVT